MLLNLVDTCQPSELRQTLTSLLQDPNVKEVCLEQKTTGGLHVSEKIVLTRRLLNLVLQAVSAENSQGLSNLKHDLTRIITGTNNDQILFPHLTADGM